MSRSKFSVSWVGPLCLLSLLGIPTLTVGFAQEASSLRLEIPAANPSEILTPELTRAVDESVAGALRWLATQQDADGSFRTVETGQPAVTALCLLAFLSAGYLPGEEKYGATIDTGIDFVLSSQSPDGLLSSPPPAPTHGRYNSAHTAMYNHAIGGLLLAEVYGMTGTKRSPQIGSAVERAITFTRRKHLEPKPNPLDSGGWRYIRLTDDPARSDLSVTSWQLMFLRSARNAGFEVPAEWIDAAMSYVNRSFDRRQKVFHYKLHGNKAPRYTRGMVGAGILALSLGGMHDTDAAHQAGDWLLRHPFRGYGETIGQGDRFHYSVFYCTQAMFQLGGGYWDQFYPRTVKTLLAAQSPQGSWPPETPRDEVFGNAYTTALAVLTLTTPYQLLPIFQR